MDLLHLEKVHGPRGKIARKLRRHAMSLARPSPFVQLFIRHTVCSKENDELTCRFEDSD